MLHKLIKLLLLLCVCWPMVTHTACNASRQQGSAEERTEQRQREQAERQREEYLERKERHLEIQSKESRASMKEMQKRSERHNYNKRRFFLARWWDQMVHNIRKRQARKPQRGHL